MTEEVKTLEEQLRRPGARGEPVVLNDGNGWLIPALPCGRRGKAILKLLDELNEDSGLDKCFDVALAILQLNYPSLTREQMEEAEGGFGLLGLDHYKAMMDSLRGDLKGPPDQTS